MPFSAATEAPFGPVFAITNSAIGADNAPGPAIAGTGAQALSGENNRGAGVGAYGGVGAGGGTGGPGFSAVGGGAGAVGGAGVTATGGVGPFGGAGVTAIGGNGTAEGVYGGAGVKAYGGGAGNNGIGAGDGIDAFGGVGQPYGAYGIYAEGGGGGIAAAWFNGDVVVEGSVAKSSGSFRIDHPLDPANKYLYHSFVESPDMMNIYNSNVVTDGRGTAVVSMPTWFEALNTDFRYQLTVIGQFAQAIVASEIANGSFTIKTGKPGVKVSWQVTGIRQDAWANDHRIQVEVDKAQPDQGHYIHPELFGHEGEPSIAQLHHPRPPAPAK